VLLGRRLVRGTRGINWRATHAKAVEILNRLGLSYDTRCPVRRLEPDQRQMVEIARALSMHAKVLILDEPTSSLTDDQVQALFTAIRRLKRDGVAIIFVSHRLPEIFAICDELTVLRDGVTVESGPIARYDADSVVAAMVGEAQEARRSDSGAVPTPAKARPPAGAAPTLKVRELSIAGVLHDVALEVRAGEIVGLAGLVGSGRSELLETLFGLRRPDSATVELEGSPHVPTTPRASISRGIGLVPPDRKTQGLLLSMSVSDNLSIVATSSEGRLRTPNRRSEAHAVAEARTAMRIRAGSDREPTGTLSGGNQQKVALGKWLARSSRLLLLDEPTRGVDVAAKVEIHERLREDRIIVMVRGRIIATLDRADATESRLAGLAAGHR
jgi:ABC-type sugar transport system ATPase subunit